MFKLLFLTELRNKNTIYYGISASTTINNIKRCIVINFETYPDTSIKDNYFWYSIKFISDLDSTVRMRELVVSDSSK